MTAAVECAIELPVWKVTPNEGKHGVRTVTVEALGPVKSDDEFTPSVARAIASMRANDGPAHVRLASMVRVSRLVYRTPLANGKPPRMVDQVAAPRLSLYRDQPGRRAVLGIRLELTMGLLGAAAWIVPAIGDSVIVAMQDRQRPRRKSA